MSLVAPVEFTSIHEQYSRPRCEPDERSASQEAYTSAPRLNSAGIPISNGSRLFAITLSDPHVAPPSNERLKAIVLSAKLFQAMYRVPSGPTNGETPIDLPGPCGLSARVTFQVEPPSEEAASR